MPPDAAVFSPEVPNFDTFSRFNLAGILLSTDPRADVTHRFYRLIALFALEVLAIILIFQVFSSVECRLTEVETACRGLRSAMIRGLCLFIGLGLFVWFRPGLRARLLRASEAGGYEARLWGFAHLAGLGLIFLPWMSADPATLNRDFPVYMLSLSLGAFLAGLGALFLLVPRGEVLPLLRAGGRGLVAVVVVSLIIPDLADALAPLWWSFRWLLVATFYGVAVLLALLGNHVILSPERSTIGTGDFFVEMAGSCSGIEGFALTTGFFVIYSVLMRDTLHLRRLWLIVFPLALLVSWLFNVIRISALILIGDRVSPELAVNGFHSFAGWLFFTILALGVLWVVQAIPALHREPAAARPPAELPPLTHDTNAALIAPFIVFMLSSLLVQSFWQEPAMAYPVQAGLVALVLWLFRRPLLRLDWRLDPVAFLAGLAVGAGWLLSAEPGASPAGLAQLGSWALAGWVICRIVGIAILVPIVEEAFFRGYLLRLLGGGTAWRTALAVGATSLAFAFLHGRIIEAGLAGVVFALIALRRDRLGDAVLAHAVANTTIAIAALVGGDWSLI
ncbi:hypothetical protein SAMN05444007_10360 [Cribrihabitans marinus]|uniref:CAAX prenyl protease 2/Lysostaphin resistance protein A-like domain-containing protein n=1 Tax=Cribrihabitans marinus TaxID=1227549 RepID=A0A1H6V095_9RHOB|nr:hypothetical protein GCM10010973_14370 [Cribrihabitans marinus]SEI98013.1 hypothetical protein SAMN05444007_10360 [Cribrihabitans marinus]